MRTHIRPARKHLFHAPGGTRRLSLGVTLSLIVLLVGTLGVSLAASPGAPTGDAFIGNYVWTDWNANGKFNLPADQTSTPPENEFTGGINDVKVNLYEDTNSNGVLDPGDLYKASQLTRDDPDSSGTQKGWYKFKVVSGTPYIVEIDPSNFAAGGPLAGMVQTNAGSGVPNQLAVDQLPDAFYYQLADFGYVDNPVEITKVLQGDPPTDPPTPYKGVGETVTFLITVKNTGTLTLDPVPLDDFYGPACLNFVKAYIKDIQGTSSPYTPGINVLGIVNEALGWLHWNNIGPLAGGASKSIYVEFTAQQTDEMYYKEGGWDDYAPKGIPDFDQKQYGWDNPEGSGSGWYYCGPVSVANSLWWFDSKFESSPVPPPTINDTYPLVPSYAVNPFAWDDHDPRNVQPFVDTLAGLMGTVAPTILAPGGTTVAGLTSGIIQHLTNTKLPDQTTLLAQYTVTPQAKPTFEWVADEVRHSEDVILLLGFWQEDTTGGGPGLARRVGGHYVTVSGVDLFNRKIVFSDPYWNNAEAGGAGRVLPGAHSDLHPALSYLGDTVHNDAQYISQDVYEYQATQTPGGVWGPVGYTSSVVSAACAQIANFRFQNVPSEFLTLQAECTQQGGPVWTEVEYAVAVSPVANTLMCSPTTNIAAVTGAKIVNTTIVLPPVQDEDKITEGADWGDLPTPYPTLLTENGARHLITSPLMLGTKIDAEANGQHSLAADWDDLNGLIPVPGDEEGVKKIPGKAGLPLVWTDGYVNPPAGGTLGGGGLEIVISGDAGVPQVWMDFGSGTLVMVPLFDVTGAARPTTPSSWPPGTYQVYFDIPAGTMFDGKQIPTLVRLSSAGGLAVTDQAPDGEVEAYIFTFKTTAVSVAAFSGRPAVNLPVIGGVAALGAVFAAWGVRRRKAALR